MSRGSLPAIVIDQWIISPPQTLIIVFTKDFNSGHAFIATAKLLSLKMRPASRGFT